MTLACKTHFAFWGTGLILTLAGVFGQDLQPSNIAEPLSPANSGEATKAQVPSEEMRENVFAYLARRLHKWTPHDAAAELGDPMRRTDTFNPQKEADGVVYVYRDPTHPLETFELNFGAKDGLLRGVVFYPYNETMRKPITSGGKPTKVKKFANGQRQYVYTYDDQEITMATDRDHRLLWVAVDAL